MAKFKVGDKVICRAVPLNVRTIGPGWTPTNASMIGQPIEVWQVDHTPRVEWYRAGTTTTTVWWNVTWLELATPVLPPAPIVPNCNCQIFHGCKCGAFKKKMESKGKIYNHVMGYWTSKQ